jgi:opacity protein-like surface antigen
MKLKLIGALAALSLNGIAYAADDQMPAKPQSGSATTAQESPSHPATAPAATSDEKTGAGTTATQSPTHPAAKENETSDHAPSGTGARGVRDWAAIDADRDNSISPEEMQKFLEKEWAGTKKSS